MLLAFLPRHYHSVYDALWPSLQQFRCFSGRTFVSSRTSKRSLSPLVKTTVNMAECCTLGGSEVTAGAGGEASVPHGGARSSRVRELTPLAAILRKGEPLSPLFPHQNWHKSSLKTMKSYSLCILILLKHPGSARKSSPFFCILNNAQVNTHLCFIFQIRSEYKVQISLRPRDLLFIVQNVHLVDRRVIES